MGSESYLNKYDKNSGGKPYFTSSQIITFLECGVEFRKRYIERLPSKSSSAAAFGTATHKAINEGNLRPKIASHIDAPLDTLQDMFAQEIDNLKPEIEWDAEEKSIGIEKVHAGLKDEGVGVVRVLRAEVTPKIQPLSVEQVIRIPLEGFARDLQGCWDIEVERGILDLKTRGRTPSQADVDKNLGLTMYALAKSVKDGRYPDFVALVGAVRLKTPKSFELIGTRKQEDFDRVLLTVGKIQHAIDNGIFLPASGLSFKCSETYCSFFKECTEKL